MAEHKYKFRCDASRRKSRAVRCRAITLPLLLLRQAQGYLISVSSRTAPVCHCAVDARLRLSHCVLSRKEDDAVFGEHCLRGVSSRWRSSSRIMALMKEGVNGEGKFNVFMG